MATISRHDHHYWLVIASNDAQNTNHVSTGLWLFYLYIEATHLGLGKHLAFVSGASPAEFISKGKSTLACLISFCVKQAQNQSISKHLYADFGFTSLHKYIRGLNGMGMKYGFGYIRWLLQVSQYTRVWIHALRYFPCIFDALRVCWWRYCVLEPQDIYWRYYALSTEDICACRVSVTTT